MEWFGARLVGVVVMCSWAGWISGCGAGADGASCAASEDADGGVTITCGDDAPVTVAAGGDGAQGPQGAPGTPGSAGTSCTVADNGDGTSTVSCGDGTSAVIASGRDGRNALLAVGAEPAGANCPDGGQRVEVGLDEDADGVLDPDEVDPDQTFYVCSSTSTGGLKDLALGFHHACVITGAGGVKCWGGNSNGELGDGTTDDSSTPVDVVGLSDVTALALGSGHSCALTSGGRVTCWGSNSAGFLGDGTGVSSSVPVDVSGLSSGVTAIAAGSSATCALTSAGGVKCWGFGKKGQLGNGTDENSLTPVDVTGLSGVSAISAGGHSTCALTSGGGVKCWGQNERGALGDGTNDSSNVPVDVSGLSSGATALASATRGACVIMAAGGVKCWGMKHLGDGTSNDSSTPVDVVGLSRGATQLSPGFSHTCALDTAGDVQCWGFHGARPAGSSTQTDPTTPFTIPDVQGGVRRVAVGNSVTCVLMTRGDVKCWGSNPFGILGDDTLANSTVPIEFNGF